MLRLTAPERLRARDSFLSEVALQVLAESPAVARLDGALRPQRLVRLGCEFLQALLVRGVQVQEISLVLSGHAQSQVEKRLPVTESRQQTRRGRQGRVGDFRG